MDHLPLPRSGDARAGCGEGRRDKQLRRLPREEVQRAAAQIFSIALGCLSLAPVGGAIVADAFFCCYPVVAVSMAFSVLVSTNAQWIGIMNMTSNKL